MARQTRQEGASAARLSPESRRDQLVRLGVDLAKRIPFDQISAADVAREAGVSKALVFHYFPTTGDLHVAIVRGAVDELIAVLDVGEQATPEDRLRHGLDAFVSYLEQYPVTYAAIAKGAGSDPQLQQALDDARARSVGLIQAALGADELAPGFRIALRGWSAMVEECVLVWLDGRPIPREDLVTFLYETAVDMLVRAAGNPFPLG